MPIAIEAGSPTGVSPGPAAMERATWTSMATARAGAAPLEPLIVSSGELAVVPPEHAARPAPTTTATPMLRMRLAVTLLSRSVVVSRARVSAACDKELSDDWGAD